MTTTDAMDGVQGGPTLPGIVVDPAWLEERLSRTGLRIVDLREGDAYVQSHVPGAVNLDLGRLGTKREGCDNVLLPPRAFADLMEELGITGGHTVVAYDDQWGLAAARLVWALHRYGHDAAAILEGGWDAWQEAEREVATSSTAASRGSFEAVPREEVGADLEWLAARVGGREVDLLDTRTSTEFDQGHLPGAISWDWFNAVPAGSWGCTRPLDELRTEWEAMGLDPCREVVVYCRSGMRAAHTYVALKHAGYRNVRLYDGSWQEWSTSAPEAMRG